MPVHKPKLLTTGQAAKLCSVTPDTILKWIKRGRLTGVRTAGGHYRIERQAIEPLIASPTQTGSPVWQFPECSPQGPHCWEYLSEGGVVRDRCRQCVVYRVRAGRCYAMAGLEPDVGHARQFCESTCDDCIYYRRVQGLATKVLLVTSDDDLIDRLTGDEDRSIALRSARNAYEASAIIQDFRPAFAAVDLECSPDGDDGLLDSLARDPRVPGLRIILVVPSGMRGRKRRLMQHELVVSVLEKPFELRQIAVLTGSFPIGPPRLAEGGPRAATRKEQR